MNKIKKKSVKRGNWKEMFYFKKKKKEKVLRLSILSLMKSGSERLSILSLMKSGSERLVILWGSNRDKI
jgi:hypothetical protein